MARRFIRVLASSLILNATFPLEVLAQRPPPAITQPAPTAVGQPAIGQPFSTEQLDALVASIALYPDDLLTQLLMASTFPLEVVAAARWVEDPANKSLAGSRKLHMSDRWVETCWCFRISALETIRAVPARAK